MVVTSELVIELTFYFILFYFILFYFILFYFILLFFLFERECKWGRGAEEEKENHKQAPYSEWEPNAGSIPQPQDHDLS